MVPSQRRSLQHICSPRQKLMRWEWGAGVTTRYEEDTMGRDRKGNHTENRKETGQRRCAFKRDGWRPGPSSQSLPSHGRTPSMRHATLPMSPIDPLWPITAGGNSECVHRIAWLLESGLLLAPRHNHCCLFFSTWPIPITQLPQLDWVPFMQDFPKPAIHESESHHGSRRAMAPHGH